MLVVEYNAQGTHLDLHGQIHVSTLLAKEKQANMVIHFITDDNPIKEKIGTQMTEEELSLTSMIMWETPMTVMWSLSSYKGR